MGEQQMAKLAFACVAVLLVFNALGDDVTEQHMSEMSRSELAAQLSATQKEAALTRSQLAAANDRISAMEIALQQQHEGWRKEEGSQEKGFEAEEEAKAGGYSDGTRCQLRGNEDCQEVFSQRHRDPENSSYEGHS